MLRRAIAVPCLFLGILATVASAQPPVGVIFRNARAVSVVVELRVEGKVGCQQAATIAAPAIPAGARWHLSTAEAVCWRRQQTPGRADGKWTAWQRLTPSAGAAAGEVTL